ncbi:type IIL restriction-modification enzyme MmeI [Streptomyces sp. P3]|uniref:type IIL restriction-modification enzyme MmeI n=1 Tax=Streptomyces sp. P3 TaxID=2135430 RepID=UPI00131F3749|nr:type IIL restriction-modification enzyme MmeI [Streptomyces sp. P3]
MATGDRLVANKGQSFQGSNVLGKGFIVTPEQAHDLIQRDPRNKDVLFPYLNGEDLNSRPDCSASRWVINFHDWSEERARGYPEVFAIVERDVKPERLKNTNRQRREIWWRFTRPAMDLYRAISNLDRVLVVALVSRTVMPARVPSRQVLSHKLGVFATAEDSDLALLSSSFHSIWAWRNSSTMKADLNYSPSDVYETFPRSVTTVEVRSNGGILDRLRFDVMIDRSIGLTKLYNMVHDPAAKDSDIESLRESHRKIDQSVLESYNWQDIDLAHDFYPNRQGTRFTVAPSAQIEILDRLLELNHAQHENNSPQNSPHAMDRHAIAAGSAVHGQEHLTPVRDGDTLF